MGKRDNSPVWITPAEFQILAKDHPTQALKAGHALRKEFIAEIKAIEDQARTVSFRITTGAVDRDHDIINPAGWNVGNYLRNPVVMFAHDYGSLPVARTLNITADSQGLVALAEFAGPDIYPFADTVFKMVKGGFLNATSVGFRPEAWTYNETRSGIDFAAQELLEFSIVPVPANPGALVEARSAGIDLAPLKSWAEETLDRLAGESGLYVPRSLVEAVAKITSGMKTISIPVIQTSEDKGFNPGAMPIETSYEWIAEKLAVTASDYCRRMPTVQIRQDDHCFVAATWADRALIVVMGYDRPWSEDHVYECSWTNGQTGPTWNGEPREVDILVHTEITPLLRAIKETIGKRGRVLSALNEGRCREAMDHALKCHDRLKEMIAQFDAEPVEEAADSPEQKSGELIEIAEQPTIDIHPSPPAKEDEPIEIVASEPPTLEFSPELIAQAIRGALQSLTVGVGEKIEAKVAAELNRLRGRID